MSAPALAAKRAYVESSVMTGSPERLIVMLYDGCRRFLAQASVSLREDNLAVAHERLQRAELILDELLVTLDVERGGEVGERLQAIYVFCQRLLSEARVQRDPRKIDQVSALLGELRDAWDQAAAAAA